MRMRPPTGPPQSPWSWESGDYLQRMIGIVVEYDNTTRVITAVTTHRDVGCLYGSIFFGLGEDGTPNSTPTQLAVPEGGGDQLAETLALGFVVIEDIFALQVTAG